VNFIIHHPGKAGEVFMGLPAAQLLKKHFPDCHITWVVLDIFRDSLGVNPYIDLIEEIPTYSCKNMMDVNEHMSNHREYVFQKKRSVIDHRGIHLDLYYGYILEPYAKYKLKLNRLPFYLQMFKNAVAMSAGLDVDLVNSWSPPEWHPTEQAVQDAIRFEQQYGGGSVIIFSPYIADKTAAQDNKSDFQIDLIYEELKRWSLPVIATGTQWDEKSNPSWVIDGYAPTLSLGALFYLMKEKAALVVTPNSGIGFAAHWLGAPTLMIDNRTGWKKQVREYKRFYPVLTDKALPHERRWPMFMKENFPKQHLGSLPFEQIEWSEGEFLTAMNKIKSSMN